MEFNVILCEQKLVTLVSRNAKGVKCLPLLLKYNLWKEREKWYWLERKLCNGSKYPENFVFIAKTFGITWFLFASNIFVILWVFHGLISEWWQEARMRVKSRFVVKIVFRGKAKASEYHYVIKQRQQYLELVESWKWVNKKERNRESEREERGRLKESETEFLFMTFK